MTSATVYACNAETKMKKKRVKENILLEDLVVLTA
jgi:hypothetical protein